jgi:hypothetical protein
MKWRSGSILALVLTILFCCVTGAGQQRDSGLDAALNKFPGYHLLALQERDSDARAYIVQHFGKSNPSVVRGDFDGDGHPDYALILKDNKSGKTRLVALLCPAQDQCRSVYDLDVTTDAGSIYIRPIPVGTLVSQTEAIDSKNQAAPLKLTSPGIRLKYFGQAEVVLYWNKKLKKIQEIQTED